MQAWTNIDQQPCIAAEGNDSKELVFHTVHSGKLVVGRADPASGFQFQMSLPLENTTSDVPGFATAGSPLLKVQFCYRPLKTGRLWIWVHYHIAQAYAVSCGAHFLETLSYHKFDEGGEWPFAFKLHVCKSADAILKSA